MHIKTWDGKTSQHEHGPGPFDNIGCQCGGTFEEIIFCNELDKIQEDCDCQSCDIKTECTASRMVKCENCGSISEAA